MHHRLNSSYPRHVAVEDVECSKIPTSRPGANVITPCKEPQQWKVGKGYNSCPIRGIADELCETVRPAEQGISYEIENDTCERYNKTY
jgi:hypothetical protein